MTAYGPAFLFLLAFAAPSASVPAADDVLGRTARAVEKFWEQFSAVTCTESVLQEKLNEHGKVYFKTESAYDYLIMLQISGNDFLVEESRVPVKQAKETKNTPLLVTNGFSTLVLVFHPFFQGGYEFSRPETEQMDGHDVLRVRFQQAPRGRSPSVLKLRQREYPLAWRGSAWIDPPTGAIVKIEAELKESMEDVGLRTLHAAVRYAPVHFTEDAEAHWLPVEAAIEAETPRQHWRNVHRFTNYKYFSVKTKSQTESPRTQ